MFHCSIGFNDFLLSKNCYLFPTKSIICMVLVFDGSANFFFFYYILWNNSVTHLHLGPCYCWNLISAQTRTQPPTKQRTRWIGTTKLIHKFSGWSNKYKLAGHNSIELIRDGLMVRTGRVIIQLSNVVTCSHNISALIRQSNKRTRTPFLIVPALQRYHQECSVLITDLSGSS